MGQVICWHDGEGLAIGDPDSSSPAGRLSKSHNSKVNTGVDEVKSDDCGLGVGLSRVKGQGDINRCREGFLVAAAYGKDTSG